MDVFPLFVVYLCFPLINNTKLSFDSVISCDSTRLWSCFCYFFYSVPPVPSHMRIQAIAPCSRKPSSSSEYHRKEVHQPHMGSGLWWQQSPYPLHPWGLRKQWVCHAFCYFLLQYWCAILQRSTHLLSLLLFYISSVSLKLPFASCHTLCNQYNSIASLVFFLMNDQGNRTVLKPNAIIFPLRDKK